MPVSLRDMEIVFSLVGADAQKRAGEGEACLLHGLLGPAVQTAVAGQLVAATELLRLSQARGHLRACEVRRSGRSWWCSGSLVLLDGCCSVGAARSVLLGPDASA